MYNRIFVNREHRDKAKGNYLMGRLSVARGNDEQGLNYFRQAYHIWSKTVRKNHPDLNMCLVDMSRIRWKLIYRLICKH